MLKARTLQRVSEAAGFGEAKHVSASGRQKRSADMLVHNAHGARPIRLFEGTPCQKAGAARRLENATRFTQCSIAFREEHHSKATSGKVEGVVGKGEIVSVGLASREVGEAASSCPLFGDCQKFGTQIESCDVTL